MQRKLLITGLMLTTLLSNSVFAYEIYKGKVTKHKVWTTGSTKGRYNIRSTTTKNYPSRSGHTSAITKILPAKAIAGQTAKIAGETHAYIWNDSEHETKYHYTNGTCSELPNNQEYCVYYSDEITLEPGGAYEDSRSPELQINIKEAGRYLIDSSNRIEKLASDDNSINTWNSSSSFNTLEVK